MTDIAAGALRSAIAELMPQARRDLAELVSFRSVADPKQYPPQECERASGWVVDAFGADDVGLRDVTASPTPDGSAAVHGHAAGPGGHADRAPLLPLRRAAAAGRGRVDLSGLGADRARRPLVRPRRGRLQGQHRHAPHRAARAAAATASCRARSSSICEGSEEQGTGGLEAFVPSTPTCCAPTRSSSSTRETSPSACPTLTSTAARDDERRRQARGAEQRDALWHVRRCRRPTRSSL